MSGQLGSHEFSQRTPERTFALRVEGELLWVSRDVLAMYSPVFRSMLFGEFRESEAGLSAVELPGKALAEVVELLRCLFATPSIKSVDEENLDLMLEFAGEYEMAELRRRCVEFLGTKVERLGKGSSDALDLIAVCSKHQLHEHIPRLIRAVAQLPVEEVEAYHGLVRAEVLAAVYQAKARKYQKLVARIPSWKMHAHAGFSERHAGQNCPDRCGSKHTSNCKKCRAWFCPNHAIGCTAHDAFQKCQSCSAPLRDVKVAAPPIGLDNCSCGYEFSPDLIACLEVTKFKT